MIAINSSTRAAIDLASIMVGIIVIGIIGGVIAATVFAVIPWAQDNAAKQAIDSVSTAESAYRGFQSDKSGDTGAYANKATLVSYTTPDGKTGLIQDDTDYQVEEGVDPDGDPCWAAVSKSASGRYFIGTHKSPKKGDTTNFNQVNTIVQEDCVVTFPEFPDTDNPETPADNTPPAGSGITSFVEADGVAASWSIPYEAYTSDNDYTESFPWAADKVNETYASTVEDVRVWIGDDEVTDDGTVLIWYADIYNNELSLYPSNGDGDYGFQSFLIGTGYSLTDFYKDGWVQATIDGVEKNTLHSALSNSQIPGGGDGGDTGGGDGDGGDTGIPGDGVDITPTNDDKDGDGIADAAGSDVRQIAFNTTDNGHIINNINFKIYGKVNAVNALPYYNVDTKKLSNGQLSRWDFVDELPEEGYFPWERNTNLTNSGITDVKLYIGNSFFRNGATLTGYDPSLDGYNGELGSFEYVGNNQQLLGEYAQASFLFAYEGEAITTTEMNSFLQQGRVEFTYDGKEYTVYIKDATPYYAPQ